eukprot:scaffold63816_cov63-Phaeocystis_antarctica.AAC.4
MAARAARALCPPSPVFPTYLPQVPQLKELCQQRSIVTKGLKKAELVWSLLSQPHSSSRWRGGLEEKDGSSIAFLADVYWTL